MASSSSSAPDLEARFTTLLSSRVWPKTACPSELPRSLSKSELDQLGAPEWRYLMPRMREMAFEMRDRGEVEVLQRGEVLGGNVRLEEVKGPIRVRAKARDDDQRKS
ncbi:MAG: hypothetical protein M1820_002570 [Bogoriella megaspora]|nr:MAG: hypothetical protein M1820_002570 [Bogoriella megaspora]